MMQTWSNGLHYSDMGVSGDLTDVAQDIQFQISFEDPTTKTRIKKLVQEGIRSKSFD